MSQLRDRALDAAIDLLGTRGMRALTHVRVDEHAGLPKGSTSNYFRTRQALVSGVVNRIVELEMPEIGPMFAHSSVEDFVNALARLLDYLTHTNRVQTTARLVLFMEASHDPKLRGALSQARVGMANGILVTLAKLGARDPEKASSAVTACFEGLLLHRIGRHEDTDPRPVLDMVIRAGLA